MPDPPKGHGRNVDDSSSMLLHRCCCPSFETPGFAALRRAPQDEVEFAEAPPTSCRGARPLGRASRSMAASDPPNSYRKYYVSFRKRCDAADGFGSSSAMRASYSAARSSSRCWVKASASLARRRQRSACSFKVARSITHQPGGRIAMRQYPYVAKVSAGGTGKICSITQVPSVPAWLPLVPVCSGRRRRALSRRGRRPCRPIGLI